MAVVTGTRRTTIYIALSTNGGVGLPVSSNPLSREVLQPMVAS